MHIRLLSMCTCVFCHRRSSVVGSPTAGLRPSTFAVLSLGPVVWYCWGWQPPSRTTGRTHPVCLPYQPLYFWIVFCSASSFTYTTMSQHTSTHHTTRKHTTQHGSDILRKWLRQIALLWEVRITVRPHFHGTPKWVTMVQWYFAIFNKNSFSKQFSHY